jgi:hypothetical protein
VSLSGTFDGKAFSTSYTVPSPTPTLALRCGIPFATGLGSREAVDVDDVFFEMCP